MGWGGVGWGGMGWGGVGWGGVGWGGVGWGGVGWGGVGWGGVGWGGVGWGPGNGCTVLQIQGLNGSRGVRNGGERARDELGSQASYTFELLKYFQC